MATKDFFALVREGDFSKIGEYVRNLRDLTTIENALISDPNVHQILWCLSRSLKSRDSFLFCRVHWHTQTVLHEIDYLIDQENIFHLFPKV